MDPLTLKVLTPLTPAFRSLYVHFPFCESKCHYCDFYSLGRERTKAGDAPQFEKALHTECELYADALAPQLDSIFFGGGTPSLTPSEVMSRILEPLKLADRLTADTEWTMEANPSSVSLEALRDYRALGINRISLGVQAMRPDLLVALGRVHSCEAALQALDSIFSAGFANASVDLLCGVPGQAIHDLELAMEALTAFPITHLSCYLLTLPKHHRMYRDLPDEDTQLSHLLFIHNWLTAHGFEHYEISNFAKPGKRARHNLHYWTGSSYLGLGPSAHSFDAVSGKRWKNISSLHRYAEILNDQKTPIEWTETLTVQQKNLERWMLALRLSDGFPKEWLDQETQRMKAKILLEQTLLEPHPLRQNYLRLTPRGFALSDQVIAELAG